MLNVPSVIDRIVYSTNIDNLTSPDGDIRKKYLRIHFVNGEYRDITNTDIVQESFNFTESLCSSDSLKFGLCEAAEVTFETVGIPNITGCKIQIFYEIDVSDLDEENQCAGRYVSDIDNCNRTIGDEVERGVYSIPIGTFMVIEAQRSKSDMTHRSIRAITKVFETNDDMTTFEQWRLAQMHKKKYFNIILPQYIDCQVDRVTEENGYIFDPTQIIFNEESGTVKDACYKGKIKLDDFNEEVLIAKGSVVFPGETPSVSRCSLSISLTCSYVSSKQSFYTLSGSEYRMYPYAYSPLVENKTIYKMDSYYMYDECKWPGSQSAIYDSEGSFDRFIKYLYDYLYNYTSDGGQTYYYRPWASMLHDSEMLQKEKTRQFFINRILSFGVKYSGTDSTKKGNNFSLMDNNYTYPYDDGTNIVGRFIVPTMITLFFNRDSVITQRNIPITPVYENGEITGNFNTVSMYVKKCTRIVPNEETEPGIDIRKELKIRYKHTLEKKENKVYKYNFENAFSMRNIINGYLEINAMFGHQSRNGKYKYISLPENATRTLNKYEYESLYYDEFDIDDIGWVLYKYKNKNDKEVVKSYSLGNNGTSVYDMSDNEIFSVLDEDEKITDKDLVKKIEGIINDYFKPSLHIIHYWPVELVVHAKPYLEAGDRYDIYVDEVNSFPTYNLNLTIKGIQIPSEEIASTTGQLIDGVDLGIIDDEDDDT